MWCYWGYSTVAVILLLISSNKEKMKNAILLPSKNWNQYINDIIEFRIINEQIEQQGWNWSQAVPIYMLFYFLFIHVYLYTGVFLKKSNTSSHKRSCFRLLQLAATLWKEEAQAVLSYLRKEYYCYAEAFVIVVVVRHTFE